MTRSVRGIAGLPSVMKARRMAAVVLALVVGSCREEGGEALVAKAPIRQVNSARLVFSSLGAKRGDEVSARIEVQTAPDVKTIGSYTARIAFDTAGLELVREEPAIGDAVQVVNPLAGEVRAAGISEAGFSEGRLLTLRFRARRDGAIEGATLTLTEVHAIDRADVLHLLESARVTAQLDPR